MVGLLIPIIIGIICIVIGVPNRKGNIDTLHSYHRKRVKEEDWFFFGRLLGLGMIVIGISLLVYAALVLIGAHFNNYICIYIGMFACIAGVFSGLVICFHAMAKYYK